MKNLVQLFFVFFSIFCFGQELHYFIGKDSLLGVKNKKNEIIIPAETPNYKGIKNGEIIKEKFIYLIVPTENIKQEKNSFGAFYDRKGNFLYQPFAFDNGPDYFSEGYQRFVKNGKVGFVDRNAKVMIEPKYDFVSQFNYGYAMFCNGCDWEKTNDEHKRIVGGIWGVINFKGEEMNPLENKISENDVEIDGKFYPYPFQYSEKEKKILDFFNNQNQLLSGIEYINVYNKLNENQKKLYFEIVERPKEDFPYYQINTYHYDKNKSNDFSAFLASKDGKNVYFQDNYDDTKIPFNDWLKKEIKSAINYQKKTKDNPNKFYLKK